MNGPRPDGLVFLEKLLEVGELCNQVVNLPLQLISLAVQVQRHCSPLWEPLARRTSSGAPGQRDLISYCFSALALALERLTWTRNSIWPKRTHSRASSEGGRASGSVGERIVFPRPRCHLSLGRPIEVPFSRSLYRGHGSFWGMTVCSRLLAFGSTGAALDMVHDTILESSLEEEPDQGLPFPLVINREQGAQSGGESRRQRVAQVEKDAAIDPVGAKCDGLTVFQSL